jgi:hypothetical protein
VDGADRLQDREDDRQTNDQLRRAPKSASGLLLSCSSGAVDLQLTGRPEIFRAQRILDETAHHSDAGCAEAKMPVHGFAQVAADDRPQQRAEVDPHIEDREAGVAPRAAFWIELPDHGADVGLQQSRSHHDQDEPGVKRMVRGNRQREVAGGDHTAAPENRPAQAEQAIGDPSTRKRRQIHACCVESVDRRCRHVVESHPPGRDAIGHEEHENAPHAVVAEPLPHLCEEERRQRSRMTEPLRCHFAEWRSIRIAWAPFQSVNLPSSGS